MKGRKPVYSVSAGERHVRPGDVAAPPLPGALPAALLPAIDGQANGHNGQHTQESAHANQRRGHQLLGDGGGKLRRWEGFLHRGEAGGLCPGDQVQGGHGRHGTNQHQQERQEISQRLFPHPAHSFLRWATCSGGYTSMTSVTIWLHSNTGL